MRRSGKVCKREERRKGKEGKRKKFEVLVIITSFC